MLSNNSNFKTFPGELLFCWKLFSSITNTLIMQFPTSSPAEPEKKPGEIILSSWSNCYYCLFCTFPAPMGITGKLEAGLSSPPSKSMPQVWNRAGSKMSWCLVASHPQLVPGVCLWHWNGKDTGAVLFPTLGKDIAEMEKVQPGKCRLTSTWHETVDAKEHRWMVWKRWAGWRYVLPTVCNPVMKPSVSSFNDGKEIFMPV